jgi:hypothetical protein
MTEFVAINIDRKSKNDPFIVHTYRGPDPPLNQGNTVLPPIDKAPKSAGTIYHPEKRNNRASPSNPEISGRLTPFTINEAYY